MCESHTAILLCVILRGSKNKADGLPKKGPTYYSPAYYFYAELHAAEYIGNRHCSLWQIYPFLGLALVELG